MTGSDIFFQVSFHILPSSLTYSLFHSAGFVSHSVKYVSHSVKYVSHTVVFVFHSVKQRICLEVFRFMQERTEKFLLPNHDYYFSFFVYIRLTIVKKSYSRCLKIRHLFFYVNLICVDNQVLNVLAWTLYRI